jgi:SRSO17 transposase
VAASSALIADRRTWLPACDLYLMTTTPLDLAALARSHWPIEQQCRELRDELGLDHFGGRSYQRWMHHIVLTAVAFTQINGLPSSPW